MMTLLLVFFVLLFSMGTVNGSAMTEIQRALQSGLGVLGEGRPMKTGDLKPEQGRVEPELAPRGKGRQPRQKTTLGEQIDQIVDRINRQSGNKLLSVGQQGQIRMENQVLFSMGQAHIHPEGLIVLRRLANALQALPHSIRIEGHTDDVPIRTDQFPSNWELSAARAVNVVKFLADKGHIAPDRLSAAGYADAKPLVTNTSSANRARNRRVEIVLQKGKTE